MKKKYSVIMPVYNVEPYVDKAIKSVLDQTFFDFELIIIDDGSTDNSYHVCKKYERDDSRIILIHQKNSGLSSARNQGLKIACGEYILFIDSDDYWYNKNVLKDIDACILENKSELIVFSFAKLYPDKGKLIDYSHKNWDYKLNRDTDTLNKFMIQENLYKACAWNKCIKKEIIDTYRMQFPEGYLNEDIIWCGDLLRYCKKNSYINKIFYVYRQERDGSITSNKNSKNISDRFDLIYEGVRSLPSFATDKDIILSYYAYEYCVSLGLAYFIKSKKTKTQLRELKKLLKNDLSKKVHIVRKLSAVFGFGFIRFLLCVFIKIKKLVMYE